MNYFYDLSLDEKLCSASIIVEEWEQGIEYTYNGKKRMFKPADVGLTHIFNISRVLYIMSNFIVNKNSYNVSSNLRSLVDNDKIKIFLNYYDKNDFIKKLDIMVEIFNFLSTDEMLKKLNFIDEIKNNYTFKDLANDITNYKKDL